MGKQILGRDDQRMLLKKNYNELRERTQSELGITDTSELKCVMLSTKIIGTLDLSFAKGVQYSDPQSYWIDGIVKSADRHITLRYGFLPQVRQAHVVEVVNPKVLIGAHVNLSRVEVWRPQEGEFDIVVMTVDPDSPVWPGTTLRDVYDALGILPNINTFSDYRPHITLGYFQPFTGDYVKERLEQQGFAKHGAVLHDVDFGDMRQ